MREWEGDARSRLCSGFVWLPLHLILKTSLGQHIKFNWKYKGTTSYLPKVFDSGLLSWYSKGIVEYILCFAAVWFLFSIFKHNPLTTQFFYLSIFNTFHSPWSTNSVSELTWNTTSSMPEMNWRWTVLKFKNIKNVLYDFFYTWVKI